MSALLALDTLTAAVLWIVVKTTIVLAVSAVVLLTLGRRTSAAARHLAWTLVLASIALLPILSVALPTWGVVVAAAPPAARVAAGGVLVSSEPPTSEPISEPAFVSTAVQTAAGTPVDGAISWLRVAAALYAIGVIGLTIYFVAQRWRLRALVQRASLVNDAEWLQLLASAARSLGVARPVRLFRSRELTIPVTFGIRRPGIMVPAIADTWPEDRRRAVILHELAHVARRDCLTQAAALGACALYWFHPAAWWTARRLRTESELACDDRVIAAGTDGRDYADHLLEIAYSVSGRQAPAFAIGMARRRQLEGRLLAALDAARNRTVPAWGARIGALGGATILLVVLSCARPVAAAAEPQQDRIGPTLVDTSSLVPRAMSFVRDAAAALGFTQEVLPGTGTWEVRATDTKGTVHLRLSERNSTSGNNVPIEQLDGLTAAQLTGAGGPVQFKVRRDAGTLNFEGVVRNGVGAGTFTFAPDPNFPAALEKRGFARPTATEQYQMARYDIGFAFIDELSQQGYAKPATADLLRAGQHGVNATYLREMSSLGFKLGSLDQLIELRDHGVTATYARELADLGHKNLGAQDLRQARDHGVSSEYAREMRGLGYAVDLDSLVQARDHGVSVEYVRDMAALGYSKLPLTMLIKARDHGVSSEYARAIKTLGYDNVPLDELINLRDHGVSAERIRDANKRAGVKLPLDMIRSLVSGGGA